MLVKPFTGAALIQKIDYLRLNIADYLSQAIDPIFEAWWAGINPAATKAPHPGG